MRAVAVGCVSLLVGLLVLALFPDLAPAQVAGTPQRVIVLFKGSTIPPGAVQGIEAAGGRVVQVFPQVGIAVALADAPAFSNNLRRSGLAEAIGEDAVRPLPDGFADQIELDGPTPADTLYGDQWNIRRVRADAAWPMTTGSSDIVVAVIDSGIASNHPDMVNLVFSSCYSSTGTCTLYPNIPFSLGGSHGTQVAGIIGAAFGHGRVVGVGPTLSLASYNVFEIDPDTHLPVAFESSIWAAMLDAATRGFKIINLSLGDLLVRPEHFALVKAWNRVANLVTQQGVTIVASAGNEGITLNGPVMHVPSDLPAVIGVGATAIRPGPLFPQLGTFDIRPIYGNFGAALTLVAPGGDCGPNNPTCQPSPPPNPLVGLAYLVVSSGVNPGFVVVGGVLRPAPGCIDTHTCAIGYVRAAGTSFAAPHVAGVAGLILSQNPSLNPHQVAAILKRSAQSLGDRQEFGHGMVDAAAAVGAAP